ncbi:cell division protein ZapA [Rhodopseudomonas palustris]|uniref:Cell division protein ZapA n=1 Tax=Rhodopseudomonas palustris (strain BisB18) TaxID=316056 RepID=Q20X50_RHOPB
MSEATSHVNVTINGRQYRMACEEGQEERLIRLADDLAARIVHLREKFGEIGDARLIVMAALMVSDELLDTQSRVTALEQERDALRQGGAAAKVVETAVVAALNSAAERIEKTTQVLNRTIGGGIAIG